MTPPGSPDLHAPSRLSVWSWAALFASALLAALVWVKVTRIGPVVLVVSERRGWGVHTGDTLGLLPLLLVLICGGARRPRRNRDLTSRRS